jgi:hypothetical protein
MFSLLGHGAQVVDLWLKTHLGRPYTYLLVFGLITGIGATVRGIEDAVGHPGDMSKIAFTVALDSVLVINQLAQLHEYAELRRTRRATRKAAKEARPGDGR